MSEDILQSLAEANHEVSAISLRYFNPIGAHKSAQLGESPESTPNNLMPLILEVASGEREKLSVYGNDYPTKDGTGVRDYIHICDLAQGHIKALQYAMSNTGFEAFNLGLGEGVSVYDLIKTFEKNYSH